MQLFRRFLLVGALATVVDVGLFVFLRQDAGWPVPVADAVAVATATLVSWLLHGSVTFPGDPRIRWYRRPGPYVGSSVLALGIDVAVVTLLDLLLDPRRGWALLVIKLPALLVAFLVRTANYRRFMYDTVRDDQRAPAHRPPPSARYRLAVVIPAFREADRIASTIERVRSDLSGPVGEGGLQVVVVDDGSDDDTADRARAAGADVVIRQTPNRGKGAAVRAGMLAAEGRTVAFTDADLSYPPEQLLGFLEAIEGGWDVAVGSRQHQATMTVVRAGRLREVGGRIVNVFTGIVLLGRYRDTQCGLKAMRADVARLVFSRTRIDGFAFDVELFHLVERYRLTLTEVPVHVVNSSRSTVHVVRDAGRLVRDLFRVRAFARLGDYELDGDDGLPPAATAGQVA
ncbi:glycosyltransferase [Dermatobacter hominis]|uniref:glycosyltransferase n=1 Tax=Dermatobacter hominis TaxID=2884263 RepID=UPI001D0FDE15|nr:glycosyltransferase [Dermatobacter hominis]UDY35618.1 glycosyltransferase [Dermatobacter hominis]